VLKDQWENEETAAKKECLEVKDLLVPLEMLALLEREE